MTPRTLTIDYDYDLGEYRVLANHEYVDVYPSLASALAGCMASLAVQDGTSYHHHHRSPDMITIPASKILQVAAALERAGNEVPYERHGLWSDLNMARAIVNTYLVSALASVEVAVERDPVDA